MLQKKQGRCAQEIELYQKEHHKKLNRKVIDEISKAGATSRKEKMAIWRRVTRDEYENETEAVKTAVKGEYEKQKAKAKEAKKTRIITERSPEDIAE